MNESAPLLPPSFRLDLCASSRFGFQGCRACADVCPHEALRFGAGPTIDADACRRCGACTAACPVGALERAYLPDTQLFAQVEAAAALRPHVLVLSCGHDPASPPVEVTGDILRLRLPCVQLVSDDLLLWAIARGAAAVVVESDDGCPNWPHTNPLRASETAAAVLSAFGWGGWRVTVAAIADASIVDRARSYPAAHVVVDLSAADTRVERRAAILTALGPASLPKPAPIPMTVPWRRVVVEERACTTCGACAFVCPSGALALSEEGGALLGHEGNCIGCNLCERACPENAIMLSAVVPTETEARVLARPNLARCRECGRPIGPESFIARVEKMLAGSGNMERSAVRLCENCKGERIPFDASEAGSPVTAAPATPVSLGAPGTPPARFRLPVLPSSPGNPSDIPGTLSRRAFLESSALVGASAVLLAGCSEAKAEKKHRYGMVIDLNRCVGCNACMIACKAENHTPPGVSYMAVLREKDEQNLRDRPIFFARPCFHCEQPSCVNVCPTGATYKRKQDGIVVVDYDKCIGCRYCITACPYGARSFDFGEHYAELPGGYNDIPSPEYREYRPRPRGRNLSPQGNVRKCTFCVHQQDENGKYDEAAGRWPACAKTCTGRAIHFGDLDDPTDPIVRLLQERRHLQLKKELGNEPNVFYLL
jgi:molybdopterin-containing oxidoreductase family iron-sulfur binding subunit